MAYKTNMGMNTNTNKYAERPCPNSVCVLRRYVCIANRITKTTNASCTMYNTLYLLYALLCKRKLSKNCGCVRACVRAGRASIWIHYEMTQKVKMTYWTQRHIKVYCQYWYWVLILCDKNIYFVLSTFSAMGFPLWWLFDYCGDFVIDQRL